MEPTIFSLKWEDFDEHHNSMINSSFLTEHFSDIILVSEEKVQFYAHRLVLCSYSYVLKDILINHPQSNPIIHLSQVRKENLESLLNILYLGTAKIKTSNLQDVLDVANMLSIPKIEEYLVKEEISDSNDDCLSEFEFVPVDNLDLKKKTLNSVDKRFDCPQCNFNSKRPSDLRRHIDAVHLEIKYMCETCDYSSKDKWRLKTHQNFAHKGIKFSCKLCEYHAKSNSRLKNHFKFEHGGCRFECPHCNWSTKRKASLIKHENRFHKTIKVVPLTL